MTSILKSFELWTNTKFGTTWSLGDQIYTLTCYSGVLESGLGDEIGE